MNIRKRKIIGLYQVIVHYRIPFYEALSTDDDFEFKLLYGSGLKGKKWKNADIKGYNINCEQLKDYKIPVGVAMPFSPMLFIKLISENPDIVFSEGSSSLINATIAFFYSKLFGKKFVWWSFGNLEGKEYTGLRKLINYFEGFIEKKSDAIFTYSNFGKKYFINRGVDSKKIFVGVNVLNAEEKLKEMEHLEEIPFAYDQFFNIVFIGTITKFKNLEVLFAALKMLNQKYLNQFKLHVIGDGPYKENLKEFFEDNNVVDHGRVEKSPGRILRNCDLIVLPGLGGLAICEGMISQLPIITGKADGTEYDLVDDKNGYILDEITVDSLVDKISYLYKNPKKRKEMGDYSFQRITQDLTFEKYYKGFKDLFSFLD